MGGAWRLNSVVLAISVVGLRVVGALPGSRLRLRKVPDGIRRGGRHGSKGGGGEGAEGEGEVEEVWLSEPAPPDVHAPSAVRAFWGGEALDAVLIAFLLREVVGHVGLPSVVAGTPR